MNWLKFLDCSDDKLSMESKIAFRSQGTGEIVILLHGYAGSVSHWDPLRPLLSKYYQVIVPNLTHLTLGRKPLTFSAQIDELARFVRKFNRGNAVHIVGLSYGAALAWGMATRYPELASRVVLINPLPPSPIKAIAWSGLKTFLSFPISSALLLPFLASRWGREFLKSSAEIFRNVDHEPSLERVDKLEGRKLQFISHVLLRFSWILRNERWDIWQKKLEFWTHDTLFIYDEADPLIKDSAYQNFSQLLGSDQLLVTQGAGHISPINSPHMICWEVMKFLLDKNSTFNASA